MFEVKEGLDDRNKDQGDFFNLKKTVIDKNDHDPKGIGSHHGQSVSKVSKIHKKEDTGNCLGTMGNAGLIFIQP